jgi:hypothetical protein
MSEQWSAQFGHANEWTEFAKANPVFLERLPNLRTALDIAFNRTGFTTEAIDELVFFSGRLCVEDFMEILLLSGNGYGVGAMKILRGMYERAVTAQYLHLHPEEEEAFFDFDWVSLHRLTKAIEGTMGKNVLPEDKLREVETNYRNVKDQFMVTECKKCGTKRLNHTWCRLDFVSMANAAGKIGQSIVPAYYLPMRHAHSTVGAIMDRLEQSAAGGLAFDAGSQRVWVRDALKAAHGVLLNVLELQGERFKLASLDDPLQKCVEDFREIWSREGD